MNGITSQLASQVGEQLPALLERLRQDGLELEDLQLECSLIAGARRARSTKNDRFKLASVALNKDWVTPPLTMGTQRSADSVTSVPDENLPSDDFVPPRLLHPAASTPREHGTRLQKRRRDEPDGPNNASLSPVKLVSGVSGGSPFLTARKKRLPDNPALQPSTLEKFINGVWESIYSSSRMDPIEVLEQWRAIESSGQLKSVTDVQSDVAAASEARAFGRMNILTRKIMQTSRTCRSLEILVQAYWVQCFDDRVAALELNTSRDKARKKAFAEACADFNWNEKELRNKMAIWRGYHDIKNVAGWSALIFAGAGLYRLCKYRISFTEETFKILSSLRHRFEVAADTLHPRWRMLLGIVGQSTSCKYAGHPHDWVVNGPGDDAIALPETYHQWDADFSYTHLANSEVDEDAWGPFDPRTVTPEAGMRADDCRNCNETQSDNPANNGCICYANLYGTSTNLPAPFQVFRTPDGKNNGLIACRPIEAGAAVGEFVGLLTSGIAGLDVMVGETERATYQIWQGRRGNHTRFVNHSCEANAVFERFVWLGKQRIVLASKGIEAGDEVTVDYGDTYWQNLDKICRCGTRSCRYGERDRESRRLVTDAVS